MKPVIGLNMSLESWNGESVARVHVPVDYVDAVVRAGGQPLCLPPLEDFIISEALPPLAGMLFIGGLDYWPEHYGGHPQPAEELLPERRDRFDLALARHILAETDIPVLAICGGHQLLALAQGGGLIQDIRTEWREGPAKPLLHRRQEQGEAPYRHSVRLAPKSLVANALGNPKALSCRTNSFHHQAVHPERLGKGFRASAWTEDGIVEAIEPGPETPWKQRGRFVLGVQWHPERMHDDPCQQHLFRSFVAASQRLSHTP